MEKAVLLSIQPKWCELIASGEKTIEVRKTMPKIHTPFKVYIYCTKDEPLYDSGEKFWCKVAGEFGNGKVIGEFICRGMMVPHNSLKLMSEQSCVSESELLEYSKGKTLYGWRISDLVIYDAPKKLSQFKKFGFMTEEDWLAALYPNTHCHYEAWAKKFTITRSPQSWCYVVELEEKYD